jgi:hypothetical protein
VAQLGKSAVHVTEQCADLPMSASLELELNPFSRTAENEGCPVAKEAAC